MSQKKTWDGGIFSRIEEKWGMPGEKGVECQEKRWWEKNTDARRRRRK
jgi:hypothetical protein